jgi:hypothetical protein
MAERSSGDLSCLIVNHGGAKQNDPKQPWQQPVIEYVNLGWSEAGAITTPADGIGNSS